VFRKIFSHGKKEQLVIEKIDAHLGLLIAACEGFHEGLENGNQKRIRQVFHLEREADVVRREIIRAVYEGAFLPYLRPNLCRFVEIVDRVFDEIEEAANHWFVREIPLDLRRYSIRVAFYNLRICEMLRICFKDLIHGDDLREKTLAVRIYEKKIDDLKFEMRRILWQLPVKDFWEGRILAEFVDGLTAISDVVEDASDYLHIINVSMK
jgi:predicted phosphate transport protein (TIGR00153 family)